MIPITDRSTRVGPFFKDFKMEKVKNEKLDLPESEKVVELSAERQSQVIGGLFTIPFSIGHGCSHRVRCPRLRTKCWGGNDPNKPGGGECEVDHIMIL